MANVEPYGFKGFWNDWVLGTAWPWCQKRTEPLFAWSLGDNDVTDATHDLSTVLWAVGFLLTQGLALIASVQNTNPVVEIRRGNIVLRRIASDDEQIREEVQSTQLWRKIEIYLASTIFPFGIMWNIIHSKKPYGKPAFHFYDRSTVSAARWSLAIGFLFALGIASEAHAQSLPGQTIHITATDVAPYEFKTDKSEGIEVTVSFVVDELPKGKTKATLNFLAKLGPSLRDEWGIAFISGSFKDAVGQAEPAKAEPEIDDLMTKNPIPFPLLDAKVGRQFKLICLLKPKDGKTPDRGRALATLNMEGQKAFSLTLAPNQN